MNAKHILLHLQQMSGFARRPRIARGLTAWSVFTKSIITAWPPSLAPLD
jgi:hypothetical protein